MGRRAARLQRLAHVILAGRQKKVRAEGGDVAPSALAVGERSPGNVQAVVSDGIEHPEPGIGTVAGEQDHLDPGLAGFGIVQGQELFHQRKGNVRRQHVFLVLDLLVAVGVHPFFLKHPVAFV